MVTATVRKTDKAARSGKPTTSETATKKRPSRARNRCKATFRRKKLEADFLRFCQLSTKVVHESVPLTSIGDVVARAENFIHSSEFVERSSESILGEELLSDCAAEGTRRASKKVSLPPHLAGLCEDQLLTAEQEKLLFRRMNFLRYRAAKLLETVDSGEIGQWELERVQGLLRAADWHRDVIVRANVRLVISIVKKFVNQQCGFDDLLSDGIMALIRSVDKFDYQLGFRFSTYATQVVRRNSYRFVMDRQDERLKITNSISDPGLDVQAEETTATMSEARWTTLRSHLSGLLDLLDKREKLIIRARFSLGGHRRVQTLQRLADKLGISKERVRQLEKRAMEKLHAMAVKNPPEIAEVEV